MYLDPERNNAPLQTTRPNILKAKQVDKVFRNVTTYIRALGLGGMGETLSGSLLYRDQGR